VIRLAGQTMYNYIFLFIFHFKNMYIRAYLSINTAVGLYTASKGAHSYWLSGGGVTGTAPDCGKNVASVPGNELINLIHYSDAARACVAALARGMLSV
jgi:hypothetical protein